MALVLEAPAHCYLAKDYDDKKSCDNYSAELLGCAYSETMSFLPDKDRADVARMVTMKTDFADAIEELKPTTRKKSDERVLKNIAKPLDQYQVKAVLMMNKILENGSDTSKPEVISWIRKVNHLMNLTTAPVRGSSVFSAIQVN